MSHLTLEAKTNRTSCLWGNRNEHGTKNVKTLNDNTLQCQYPNYFLK